MIQHPKIKHPDFYLDQKSLGMVRRINEQLLDFIADHILPSTLLADIALIVPLLAVQAPDSVKLMLAVFSGSWIQWWALHILQRSNLKAEKLHNAKAKADHLALTHVALQQEKILRLLEDSHGK